MSWYHRIADSRPPDFVIGDNYLRRWWLIPRNAFFNVYLHQFLHSDEDRALHDHMYVNLSILLEGTYWEHTIAAGGVHHRVRYSAGAVRFRLPSTAHRIEIAPGTQTWSLFITGPRVREWGFHCPNGWRHWKQFVDDRDHGRIGRGCE